MGFLMKSALMPVLLAGIIVLLCEPRLALAEYYRLDNWKAEQKLPSKDWRTFSKPLSVAGDELLLFQRDYSRAVVWRQNWRIGSLESTVIAELSLGEKERYTTLLTSKGLWFIGKMIVLVRPDGSRVQVDLGLGEPMSVGLSDGNVMLFDLRHGKTKNRILMARDGSSGIKLNELEAVAADGQDGAYRLPYFGMTATLLDDGRVLMAGGDNVGKKAEIIDPYTGLRSLVPDMPHLRHRGIALRLPDGRVLMAGSDSSGCNGESGHTVDVYEPARNAWASLPALPFPLCADAYGADIPAATFGADGRVVLGGHLEPFAMVLLPTPDALSHYAAIWRVTATMPMQRISGVLQVLSSGDVVVAGGVHSGDGCCFATPGFDRLPPVTEAGTERSLALTMAGVGAAKRESRVFVGGGRRYSSTHTGQVRYSSMAELIQLPAGPVRQIASLPFPDGAVQAEWLDGKRVLVKGRLASSDDGFLFGDNLGYMPKGNGGVAIYHVEADRWETLSTPKAVHASQLVGIRNGIALFMGETAFHLLDVASLSWKELDIPLVPEKDRVARWLQDGRLIVAGGRNICRLDLGEEAVCDPSVRKTWKYYVLTSRSDLLATTAWSVQSSVDPAAISASLAIDQIGRVTQLGWKEWSAVNRRRADNERLFRPVLERSHASSEQWRPLPVPFPFYLKADKDSEPCLMSEARGCRLVNVEDPRRLGTDLLFMVQGKVDAEYVGHGVRRHLVLWWFDEEKQRWQRMLSAENDDIRATPLALPVPLSSAGARMMSMGWHLEHPLLWMEESK